MEDKGLVTFRDGSPTPERGGRAKRFVTVTREGRNALASAQSAFQSLLDGLDLLTNPVANLVQPRIWVPQVALLRPGFPRSWVPQVSILRRGLGAAHA